jgi:hypothetical protein
MPSSLKEFSWLVILVCVIVWFVGEAALGGGLSSLDSHGLMVGIFAGACVFLWATSKFDARSSAVSTAAFVAIGLWALKLGIALFIDFRNCISSGVFWSFILALAIPVTAIGISGHVQKTRLGCEQA